MMMVWQATQRVSLLHRLFAKWLFLFWPRGNIAHRVPVWKKKKTTHTSHYWIVMLSKEVSAYERAFIEYDLQLMRFSAIQLMLVMVHTRMHISLYFEPTKRMDAHIPARGNEWEFNLPPKR